MAGQAPGAIQVFDDGYYRGDGTVTNPEDRGSPFGFQNPLARTPDLEGYHTIRALVPMNTQLINYEDIARGLRNLLR